MPVLLCLLLAQCVFLAGWAQKPDRFLARRGTDSLWVVDRSFAAPRFYLGNQRVTRQQFLDHLERGDEEVAQLVQQGRKYRRTSLWYDAIGGGLLFTGLITLNLQHPGNYTSYHPENNSNAIPLAMLGAGLVLDIVGFVFWDRAAERFRQGLSLFNYKAQKGTTVPVQLRLGKTQSGNGISVNF